MGRYRRCGADAGKVKCVGAVSNGDAVSFYQLAEAEGWTKRQQIFGPVCGLMEGKDMENSNNTFLAAKAAIAAVCGAFTAAFGRLGWLVMAGRLHGAGLAQRQCSGGKPRRVVECRSPRGNLAQSGDAGGGRSGRADGRSIEHCRGKPAGLGATYSSLILPVVLVWYIFTELGSIAENAAEMGANVPEWLLKLLAAGKSAADKSAGGITVGTGKNADGSPIGHLEATQLDELKMEDLEQLAIDMGLTVQDGAKRADLIAQISAEPVKVPNGRK